MFASSQCVLPPRPVWSADGAECNRLAASVRPPAECCILLLAGLCLLRTFVLDWYQVSSGSMAPALLGPHRNLTCPRCGFQYHCDALDEPPPGKRALCPNCWSWGPELVRMPATSGERLLLVRGAWGALAPRRWSVVACRAPHRASRIQVKRVLGLPGEVVELRRGDVYINGRLVRKNLEQQHALAQLVHVATHDPTRWVCSPAGRTCRWQQVENAFLCSAEGQQGSRSIQWLIYRHQQLSGMAGSTREAPPDDHYAYNQVRTVPQSFPVDDLLLSCRLAWRGSGQLFFRLQSGRTHALIEVAFPTGELTLTLDGTTAARTHLNGLKQTEQLWEVSAFDGQILLAIDGRTVFSRDLPQSTQAGGRSARPLALGTRGLALAVRDLRVWRDVYYYWPERAGNRQGPSTTVKLGPDEYFVAGDNVPFSVDSRSWPAQGVPQYLLVGRPLFVYLRSRPVRVLGLQVSIPQLSSIRYIR